MASIQVPLTTGDYPMNTQIQIAGEGDGFSVALETLHARMLCVMNREELRSLHQLTAWLLENSTP